jgi:hypothetical protein
MLTRGGTNNKAKSSWPCMQLSTSLRLRQPVVYLCSRASESFAPKNLEIMIFRLRSRPTFPIKNRTPDKISKINFFTSSRRDVHPSPLRLSRGIVFSVPEFPIKVIKCIGVLPVCPRQGQGFPRPQVFRPQVFLSS